MTYEEIRRWVQDNSTMMPETQFSSEELDHVAYCMEHIQEWYNDGHDLGDFLTSNLLYPFS